jgi:hypothetical protein
MKDHGKHLWMGVIVLVFLPILVKFKMFEILDLRNAGIFFRLVLSLLVSTVVGFCIEWYQGVFYGANKGEPGKRFWQQHWFKDMTVTGLAGFVGAIIAEIVFI